MKSTSKKIFGLLFIVAVGTSSLFANVNNTIATQPEVTDAELEQFAVAFQGLRVINQKAQQEMIGIVQKEGMELKRFNEIQQATMNPEAEVKATQAEKKKHKEISVKLKKVQLDFQGQMEKTITNTGLSMQRYQEIATQLQKDPKLQERLKKVLQN